MSLRRAQRHHASIQRRRLVREAAVREPWRHRPGDPAIEAWLWLWTEEARLAARLRHAEQRAQWRRHVGLGTCRACGERRPIIAEATDWVEGMQGLEVTAYSSGAIDCDCIPF